MKRHILPLLTTPLFVLILVALSSSVSKAQDDTKQLIAQTQNLLSGFACPEGASTAACDTFRKMIATDDGQLAYQFSPLFADPKYFMGMIYVVFDSSTDNFWIIGLKGAHNERQLVLALVSYAHYNHGDLIVGALGHDLPVQNLTTFNSPENGVVVTYHLEGNVSVSTQETTQRSNGAPLTFSIEVNKTNPQNLRTADETITAQSGGTKVAHTGKALKLMSGNLDHL